MDENYKVCKFCGGKTELINKDVKLVKCLNCSLIFCNKIYSQEEIKNVYDELYNKKLSHYVYHTENEYNKLIKGELPHIGINRKKVINKYINNKQVSILEIGSGVGLIGTYLKFKGINDYEGIELDKETYLKSKKLGLNTINGDFSLIKKLKNHDLIMLWEVLEHLQDLKLFFNLAYLNLNKNGVLMFSVPNYNKVLNYKKSNKIYQDNPPIHLNFFTTESIKEILEKIGFKVELLYIKKRPYLNLKSISFYKSMFKSLVGKYHGSTIYLVAKKM